MSRACSPAGAGQRRRLHREVSQFRLSSGVVRHPSVRHARTSGREVTWAGARSSRRSTGRRRASRSCERAQVHQRCDDGHPIIVSAARAGATPQHEPITHPVSRTMATSQASTNSPMCAPRQKRNRPRRITPPARAAGHCRGVKPETVRRVARLCPAGGLNESPDCPSVNRSLSNEDRRTCFLFLSV